MSATPRNVVFASALLLALWLTRDWMQAHMARHMLLQMPLLAWSGWLLHASTGKRVQGWLEPWNYYGLSGFLFIQCVAAFWMVPRALDLALVSSIMAGAKVASWILGGFLLRQSAQQSNIIVELFMLGNFAMMTAAVSDIYERAPIRLCNAYVQGDQVATARGLLWLLLAIFVVWGLRAWRMHAFAEDGPLKLFMITTSDRAT